MRAEDIENRIKNAFPDCDVVVMDTTGGGDHFDVRVVSKAFEGKSRIQQHQAVMAVFAAELKTGELHALALKTFSKI